MNTLNNKIIYTIGHSTHTASEFLSMLRSFDIRLLVDVRSLPGSNKFPQFNKENLQPWLESHGITYLHMADLGGRRRVHKDSHNDRWHKDAFRGYADYMESNEFKAAIQHLEALALQQCTVYMCAEALWWRCHRSMISDYLLSKGWLVRHIMGIGKVQEHTYTQPAIIVNGVLSYSNDDLG